MNYRLKHFLVILIVIQLYVTFIENYDDQQHQHAQEYTHTYPCCNYLVEIYCINQRYVQIGRYFNFWPNLQHFQYLVKKYCHELLDGEMHFYKCDQCRQKPFLIYESNYLTTDSQPSSVSSQSIQTNKPISFSEKSTAPIQKLKTSTTLKSTPAPKTKPTTTPKSTTIETAQSSKIEHPTTTKSTPNLKLNDKNDHDSDQSKSKSPEPNNSNSAPLLITFIVILIVINFILIGYNTKKILKKIQKNLNNQNAEMNGQIQTGPTNRQIPPQLRINPNANGELYENRDPIYASLDWNR